MIDALQRRLGHGRVRVGKDGFEQVCREIGVDDPKLAQLSLC